MSRENQSQLILVPSSARTSSDGSLLASIVWSRSMIYYILQYYAFFFLLSTRKGTYNSF
jgi:hypothetical protein